MPARVDNKGGLDEFYGAATLALAFSLGATGRRRSRAGRRAEGLGGGVEGEGGSWRGSWRGRGRLAGGGGV